MSGFSPVFIIAVTAIPDLSGICLPAIFTKRSSKETLPGKYDALGESLSGGIRPLPIS